MCGVRETNSRTGPSTSSLEQSLICKLAILVFFLFFFFYSYSLTALFYCMQWTSIIYRILGAILIIKIYIKKSLFIVNIIWCLTKILFIYLFILLKKVLFIYIYFFWGVKNIVVALPIFSPPLFGVYLKTIHEKLLNDEEMTMIKVAPCIIITNINI